MVSEKVPSAEQPERPSALRGWRFPMALMAAAGAILAVAVAASALDVTGTEFYAVDLENTNVGPLPFGIGVHNVDLEPAEVDLYQFDVGLGHHDRIDSQTILPGQGHVFTPAGTPLGGSGISKNSVYVVISDRDVAAIQSSPHDSVQTNDVAELLPLHSWGTDYRVMTYHPFTKQSFITILAAEKDTQVTVVTTAANAPGGGVGTIPVGVPTTYTLQPTEALHIRSAVGGDLTGSTVQSNNPVAVFAGAVCTTVGTSGACDTLTEQVWPEEHWGSTYVACRAPQRSTEPVTLRIMALKPGLTEVKTTPPLPGFPFNLTQGAWHDFMLMDDVLLEASQNVSVGEFLHGDPSGAHWGDPSFTQYQPIEHMGYGMQFLIPPNFPENIVTIAAESAAVVSWETSVPVSGWVPIPGTDYKCARDATTPGVHILAGDLTPMSPPPGSDPLDPAECILFPEEDDIRQGEGDLEPECPVPPPTPPEPPVPRFIVRAYGHDWYGSYGFPIHANVTDAPRVDEVTYAAADRVGGELLITGNDPGCGLGDSDSYVPRGASLAQFRPPTPLSDNTFNGLVGPMKQDRFLHGAATLNTTFTEERHLVIGGTRDCNFTPRADIEELTFTETAGASPFTDYTYDLNQARIAPAVATDRNVGRIWVAGGDSTGGPPRNADSWHVPTASLEERDPIGKYWLLRETMPAGVSGAAALYDTSTGLFVVSGGASHPQVPNRFVQMYAPWTNNWLGDHVPTSITGHSTVECNGWPYVIGGIDAWMEPGMVPASQEMYHYTSGRQGFMHAQRDLGDGFTITPPPSAQYHASAVWGNTIIMSGGYDGGAVTDQVYTFNCLSDTSPWLTTLPPLPMPLAEHGMEVVGNWLIVMGGTDMDMMGSWTGRLEGGCPMPDIWRLDLTATWMGWQPSTQVLATPTFHGVAGMGTTVMPDGTIALVGGRTEGPAADGSWSCHIPTDRVWFYNPVTDTLTDGPSLPEALIAPAVHVRNEKLIVAGGDETGDFPVPGTAFDTRQRRPSTDTYLLEADTGIGSLLALLGLAPASAGWTPLDILPMGVVHGEFTQKGDVLYVVGGNQHPETAVRAVQPFGYQTFCQLYGLPAPPCPVPVVDDLLGEDHWIGPHLAVPLMHHGMEYDVDTRHWAVHGGVTNGNLYITRADVTTLSGATYYYGFTASSSPHVAVDSWIPAVPGTPRAFPVGYSGVNPVMATGTTPDLHRTKDLILT